MKLEIITILYIMIWMLHFSAFGQYNFIDISLPYAHGNIKLTDNTIHDTIIFSNGTKLVFYQFSHPGISSGGSTEWCFLFTDSVNQTSGFRFDTNVSINKYAWMDMGEFYFTWVYNSQDTILNNLMVYPDSLSPIDTFSLYYPNGPIFTGKLIMATIHIVDGHVFEKYEYNTIVYVCDIDNRKIAFQFSDLLITGISPKEVFQSIIFNWVADSAGNGIFKIPTSITHFKNCTKNYNYILKNTTPHLCDDYFLKQFSLTCYDVRGRVVGQHSNLRYRNESFSNASNGVYLLRTKKNGQEISLKLVNIQH